MHDDETGMATATTRTRERERDMERGLESSQERERETSTHRDTKRILLFHRNKECVSSSLPVVVPPAVSCALSSGLSTHTLNPPFNLFIFSLSCLCQKDC